MHHLKRFLIFWRNFLIGDDWVGAGIAIVGFALTYVAVRKSVPSFWILPAFVIVSVAVSLWRKTRKTARGIDRRQAARK